MVERDAERDDIAVIGMACRYPGGVRGPEDLWTVVSEGRDGVGDFPSDRDWHTEDLYDPGYVRQGGFLDEAALFDAEFFGIRPAEAKAMDPQQRVLLETAWEAIERAGIVPSSLKGTQTGVFVGVMPNEYGMPLWKWQGETAGFMGSGTSPSVASGRISYLLGLEGPALTIDTACSSSGVAIHTAVRSLRSGETTLALAGGCTVLTGPGMFVDYARKQALSPDARCRTFSDAANGTVWAEGSGVLVLERLSTARRLGRRILGVIKGTAVNQDGASNGLTAPNGRAQVKVINRALADAGLSPQDIQLVEAHGTATKLGDPIEVNAIHATYGKERDEPVWLGSLKSNIGHSMAAAGVGGVIKCLTAMRAGRMPRTIHVDGPLNSLVDWSGTVEVLRENRTWPVRDGVRRCAVSSFGVSGTNSHVVLESWEEPEPEPTAPQWTGRTLLKLSARKPAALRAAAEALIDTLESGTAPPAAVARSLLFEKEDYDCRAVVTGDDRAELLTALRSFVADPDDAPVVHGEARRIRRPVFVFPGQGGQWPDMARALLEESEVFRRTAEECAVAFKPYLDFDVVTVLSGDAPEVDLDRTDVVQPLLFTVMVGLAAVWRSLGVEPAAVVGHSQGEVAAACVAGALGLDDAAAVVACRSRLLEEKGRGGMAAVAASADEATRLMAEADADLVVAAVNGPSFVVVSGVDEPGMERLLALCDERGVFARKVPTKCASHSWAVEELREDILAGLTGITPASSRLPLFSTVDARPLHGEELDAEYWYRNLRGQVRFAETIEEMVSHGYDAFVEISPHPVLVNSVESILHAVDSDAPVNATLKRDQGTIERLREAAAEAYVQGHAVDWNALGLGGAFGRAVPAELPTYPFQRERFWLTEEQATATVTVTAPAAAVGHRTGTVESGSHPWLSGVVETAVGSVLLSGRLSLRSHPWLMDHRVGDTALLPGTAFMELLLSAGRELGCAGVDEMVLSDPLFIPMDGAGVDIQVSVDRADTQGARPVVVFSRPEGADSWQRHAEGLLTSPAHPGAPAAPADTPGGTATELRPGDMYERLRAMGYGYGEAFQGVREAEHRGEWVRSRIALPPAALVNHRGFAVHPALTDAALHAAVACGILGDTGAGQVAVPFVFNGVRTNAHTAVDEVYALARRVDPATISLVLTDGAGAPLLSVERMVVRGLQHLPGADLDSAALYETRWEPVTAVTTADRRLCVVGGDEGSLARFLRDANRGGISVATLDEAVTIVRGIPGDWQVVVPCAGTDDGTAARVHAAAARTLDALQTWLRADDLEGRAQLTFVTQDTTAVPGDASFSLDDSAVWGMVRSAQTEHPGQFRIIDVSASALRDSDTVLTALKRTEPQLAVRDGRVLRPQFAPYVPGDAVLPDLGEGAVVITGGTGTLGREVARHLAARWGARALALVSRSGEQAPGIEEFRSELSGQGVAVQVIAADVADADDLRRALAEVRAERPVAGVIHAAGLLDDSIVSNMTPDKLHKVLRSKVDSTLHLDAATRDDDLRFFMLFSSLYGLLGGPGQANYAGANAFLDQFAARRRAQGRPVHAVAWGLWAEATGMTGHLDEGDLLRLRRNGVAPFSVAEGLELFDRSFDGDVPALVGARLAVPGPTDDVDAPFLLTGLARQGGRVVGTVSGPAPVAAPVPVPAERRESDDRPTTAREPVQDTTDLLALLVSPDTSADRRVAALLGLIKECVAALLGTKPARVDAQKSFYEMGFDSLTTMELRGRLSRLLDVRLGATVVFDHPTPEALADRIAEMFAQAGPEEDRPESVTVPAKSVPVSSGEPRTEPQAPAAARPDSEPFPLTKLQEAYLAGRRGHFELGNVPTVLYIEVDLTAVDVHGVQRALRRLVGRHEMLRAVFDPAGTQRVLGQVPDYHITVEDLSLLDDAQRTARLAEIHQELRAHTFDTSQWPLFLVRATRIDATRTRLHVAVDVLISDGGSSTLLFDEWARLYRDPDTDLTDLNGSFEEFVRELTAQQASDAIEPSRTYWRERLTSLPPAPELPLAVSLGEVRVPVFGNRRIRIDEPRWSRFKRNAGAAGITPSSAILAAYCQVLARWSKSPHFTINVLVSHRSGLTDQDMSGVVGNFSSTTLLEAHIEETATFQEVAAALQRQLMHDLEHVAHTGLDVLRDLGRLDREVGRARMPVVFNSTLGGTPTPGAGAVGPVGALCRLGESGTPVWSGVRTPQVILDHQVFEEEGDLILNWDVVEEVFPDGVVDAMITAYEGLIDELCR
ncbi:SDR family NAD(P)-dependent oxidoreductase [Streptomyces sp. NPDC019531]|uniref:SDR family NAD(P)-dependent oxidoreductase n=1 Tax=Streptomyces sp. NPDC019531 TaxID=3365062 RepID=UPI00385103CB